MTVDVKRWRGNPCLWAKEMTPIAREYGFATDSYGQYVSNILGRSYIGIPCFSTPEAYRAALKGIIAKQRMAPALTRRA